MAIEELKQAYNSAYVVVIVVVTIAVAILEYRQKQFHARHLIDYDLEFLNLEDTCPRLPITLIFNYKRNKHTKKIGDNQRRTKTKSKQGQNRIQEQELRLHQRRICRSQSEFSPPYSSLVVLFTL